MNIGHAGHVPRRRSQSSISSLPRYVKPKSTPAPVAIPRMNMIPSTTIRKACCPIWQLARLASALKGPGKNLITLAYSDLTTAQQETRFEAGVLTEQHKSHLSNGKLRCGVSASRPDFGERWLSRLVATAAEDRLNVSRNLTRRLRQPAIAEQSRFMSTRPSLSGRVGVKRFQTAPSILV
jgi:hypothetical protein